MRSQTKRHCILLQLASKLAASSDRIAIVFVVWILYRASGFRIVKISPIIGARVTSTASTLNGWGARTP
jgi:hypothetical protein